MNLFPEEMETIAGVSAALRAGAMSCVDVLASCLAKIEHWEPRVHAWVHLDLEGASAEAEKLDEELKEKGPRSPLHGIPIGIKDIIDVAGMPTACGSKLWKDRIAERDARVVAELKKAGAIILGKTVTTAYAWVDPPVTRNPWNLERTPGGSSSGSAAAVATGMCLGAIGTQTGGSIIRPSSFCGVAGFNPSVGCWICGEAGILPFAPTFDRVGPIARSVDDLAILYQAMADPLKPEDEGLSTIGILGGPFWDRAEPSMRLAFHRAIEAMATRTVESTGGESLDFDRILRAHRTIMATEAAANHRDRLRSHPDDYPPRIRSLIEEGLTISGVQFVEAEQLHRDGHDLEGRSLRDDYDEFDCLLKVNQIYVLATPAAVGPAPDLTTTGDPSFQAPWSFLGLPAVTVPIGLSPEGLPLGIQLIGRAYTDRTLLAAAIWCERVVRAAFESGALRP